MADEIRRTPINVPPPGAAGSKAYLTPEQLPGDGRLPLKVGQVVMTDYTRQQLLKLGWRDGDPVPGDLGGEIQRIQAEIDADLVKAGEQMAVTAANRPKPRIKLTDISELPAAKQAELRQYVANFKAESQLHQAENAAKQQADAAVAQFPPGTNPSIIAAARANYNAGAMPTASVVQGPPTLPLPAGSKPAAAPPPPSPPPAEPAAAPAEPAQTGIEPPPVVHCPRCLYDVRVPFEVKADDADKERFVISMMPGATTFKKQYELFAGKMVVTFRALLSKETQELNAQLGRHVRAGEIIGDGAYFDYLMEYRLLLSFESINMGGHITATMPAMAEFAKTQSDTPVLLRMKEHFYDQVASQESFRRLLGQQHRLFQRLIEYLEVMASEPDFYRGIELPG